MEKKKYLILDFGNVIAYAKTGNWHITPHFLEVVDINKIDIDKFNRCVKKNSDVLSRKMITIEEEYEMFTEFYDNILREINYPEYDISISKDIAYDRAYNNGKFTLYDGVEEELKKLNKDYDLIMLTDNWPSVNKYLKEFDLDKYFKKVYVSAEYKQLKIDGLFFDNPINDFNINPKEAWFIDDYEPILDVASKKGLNVLQMDRSGSIDKSKYKIIKNLSEIN